MSWSPNLTRVERRRVIVAGRTRYEIDYLEGNLAEVWIYKKGYWSLFKHSITHKRATELSYALDPKHTI